MGKTVGVIAGVLLVAGIIFFGMSSMYKNRSPSNQSTNSTSTSQTKTTGGKFITTCTHYETGATGFKANDTSPIPTDIAALGSGETLCGSVAEANTVYYLTEKSDTQLEDVYKTKMLSKGCTVAAIVTPAPGHEVYSLNISFTCADGHYYIGSSASDNGYWVTFNPSR
jgi:hypothetical protein